MALTIIYPNGSIAVNIPATESISISNYGGGIASIYYMIEDANRPDAFQLQQTLENASVTLGAFSSGKIVKIESGASTVKFDVGASPDPAVFSLTDHIAAADPHPAYELESNNAAADILTKLLTVDGTGSGLDADTLDGQHGSYYATNSLAAHLAGTETFTGVKTIGSTAYLAFNTSSESKIYLASNTSGIGVITASGAVVTWGSNAFVWRGGGTSPGSGTIIMNLNTAGNLSLTGDLSISTGTADDSIINFYDLTNTTLRSLRWDDSESEFRLEDSSGTNRTIYHTGINPSLGAGNGISGTIDTTAVQTITVTNGIITAIA